MLSRLVRIQLAIFSIVSAIGILAMTLVYMQVPTLLGIGRMTVTLKLPITGGLYRFSEVTYRGLHVGTVTGINLTSDGADATLSLNSSVKVPANLQAEVRSVSPVGEQYVDLRPRTDAAPYLHDGSVIAKSDAVTPQAVGPMLDQVSALIGSIPKDRLGQLLDDSFQAFNGAGYAFGSLIDSSATIANSANSVSDRSRSLIDDSVPLLDSQVQTSDAIRTWAHSLAGVTGEIAAHDPQVRTILERGPGFAQEVSRLLEQVKPTLPVLLANLQTLGQVLVTYNPSLEQVLVLLPGVIAANQSYGVPFNDPLGLPRGDFTLSLSDPPACTVGFLPPSEWRSPADTTTLDAPDGLYCKLPQDSPIAVRGARNFPCMEHPGKRAPTVELCNDPKGFQPLTMRQHTLGPYPLDPNLISQGVPIDSRALPNQLTFGPVDGTPLPPIAPAPSAVPPGPALPAPPAPGDDQPPGGGAAPAAPSAFGSFGSIGSRSPSVAVATYDSRTGRYMTPDGHLEQIVNLPSGAVPRSWTELLPTT
jgi:virulence factor Mce-like protein